jgi:hypothetical protein
MERVGKAVEQVETRNEALGVISKKDAAGRDGSRSSEIMVH